MLSFRVRSTGAALSFCDFWTCFAVLSCFACFSASSCCCHFRSRNELCFGTCSFSSSFASSFRSFDAVVFRIMTGTSLTSSSSRKLFFGVFLSLGTNTDCFGRTGFSFGSSLPVETLVAFSPLPPALLLLLPLVVVPPLSSMVDAIAATEGPYRGTPYLLSGAAFLDSLSRLIRTLPQYLSSSSPSTWTWMFLSCLRRFRSPTGYVFVFVLESSLFLFFSGFLRMSYSSRSISIGEVARLVRYRTLGSLFETSLGSSALSLESDRTTLDLAFVALVSSLDT